ncbi:MAG: hypothetical protein ACPLKQ_00870 [Candidatus Bathyarchaeales archaeon]
MESKKKISAMLATTIIMLSFLVVAFEIQATYADSITGDYALVNGVLATDKYSLYPFAHNKSLTIGFSKYGEMIDDRNNVGLEYGAVDPFAAPAGSAVGSIPKVLWIQGWLINISYYNIPQSKNRNVWAYAAFSDANAYGGSWIRVDFANDYSATYGREDPRDPGYIIGNYGAGATNFGGRKTNGTAVTQPIQVLYNGPRLFVALLNTTIYDHPVFLSDSTANDIPLVRVVFTIMFNKVKKEVVILKDVKSLLTEKTGVSMNIQFSNRGEVDLGTEAAGYHSRFHFFTQGTALNDSLVEGQPTVYNSAWTACPTVDLGADSAVGGMPQTSAATYDVAQAINTGAGYVWWAAFWPSLSDWTIDGWGIHWRSMTAADPHWVDGDPDKGGEPRIPFYIGEWDFKLYAKEYAANNPIEFRGVTVYGVTDLNDGKDTGYGSGSTATLDSEVLYQLNEIFKPWDLYSAVEKSTSRFVIKETKTVTTTTRIDYCVGLNAIISKEAGNNNGPSWYTYSNFTERVIVDGVLITPEDTSTLPYYEASQNTTEHWFINVTIPAGTHTIKILWSNTTDTEPGRYEWGVVGRDAHSVDSAGLSMVSAAFKNKQVEYGLAGADMYAPLPQDQMPYVMHKFGTGNTWKDYYYSGTDYRTALRDDWCTTWPVASSNMIGVGGPLANLLAYYGNDFAQAIYGLNDPTKYGDFTNFSAWEDAIIPLTCWDITKTRTYRSTNTTGYAVISTYQDINGTALFLVWGHWGRDTYYASKWFHEEGVYQLQDAPQGLTAIILKITYENTSEGYKPKAYSIVECLGTISEIKWTHGSVIKGGIHDP